MVANENFRESLPCETCLLNPVCEEVCDIFPLEAMREQVLRIRDYKRVFGHLKGITSSISGWVHMPGTSGSIKFSHKLFVGPAIHIRKAPDHIPEQIIYRRDGMNYVWGEERKTPVFFNIITSRSMTFNDRDRNLISIDACTFPMGKRSDKKIKRVYYDCHTENPDPNDESLWMPALATLWLSNNRLGDYAIAFEFGRKAYSNSESTRIESKRYHVTHNGVIMFNSLEKFRKNATAEIAQIDVMRIKLDWKNTHVERRKHPIYVSLTECCWEVKYRQGKLCVIENQMLRIIDEESELCINLYGGIMIC